MDDAKIIDDLRRRRDRHREWLMEEAPYITEDQKHLDANTPERAYWQYGYYMAVTDIVRLMEADISQSTGNADTS